MCLGEGFGADLFELGSDDDGLEGAFAGLSGDFDFIAHVAVGLWGLEGDERAAGRVVDGDLALAGVGDGDDGTDMDGPSEGRFVRGQSFEVGGSIEDLDFGVSWFGSVWAEEVAPGWAQEVGKLADGGFLEFWFSVSEHEESGDLGGEFGFNRDRLGESDGDGEAVREKGRGLGRVAGKPGSFEEHRVVGELVLSGEVQSGGVVGRSIESIEAALGIKDADVVLCGNEEDDVIDGAFGSGGCVADASNAGGMIGEGGGVELAAFAHGLEGVDGDSVSALTQPEGELTVMAGGGLDDAREVEPPCVLATGEGLADGDCLWGERLGWWWSGFEGGV